MTPEQTVAALRAYVAANPSPFRDRGLLSERVELEDEAPEPSLAELCRPCREHLPGTCGEDTCVCGEPITRFASHWWHTHGRRDHHATPAVKENP